jgi:hypothetical protein
MARIGTNRSWRFEKENDDARNLRYPAEMEYGKGGAFFMAGDYF